MRQAVCNGPAIQADGLTDHIEVRIGAYECDLRDAVARRILELMREDTSTARSMEEKAMRAQVRYDQERGAVPP